MLRPFTEHRLHTMEFIALVVVYEGRYQAKIITREIKASLVKGKNLIIK